MTLSPERQSARMSKITNDGRHRMIDSCTHMAALGIKGLRRQGIFHQQEIGWEGRL